MKALLQRVTGASVSVVGEVVGRTGRGLVVLVGVANGDTEKDTQYLAQKTVNLRTAAMDDDRINAYLFKQDDIECKLFFQVFIHHGVTTIFYYYGFMTKFLHIRKRLDEDLSPLNTFLHNVPIHGCRTSYPGGLLL